MGKGDPEAPLVVVSSAGNKPFATSVNGGGKGDLVDMNLPEIGVVATTEDTLLFSTIETANRVLPRLTVRYSIRSSSWSLETLPQYQFALALPTQPKDPQNVRLQFVAEVFLANHAINWFLFIHWILMGSSMKIVWFSIVSSNKLSAKISLPATEFFAQQDFIPVRILWASLHSDESPDWKEGSTRKGNEVAIGNEDELVLELDGHVGGEDDTEGLLVGGVTDYVDLAVFPTHCMPLAQIQCHNPPAAGGCSASTLRAHPTAANGISAYRHIWLCTCMLCAVFARFFPPIRYLSSGLTCGTKTDLMQRKMITCFKAKRLVTAKHRTIKVQLISGM
nr:hypothetical protein Iba_chr05bCG6880 [Ipomoea batatas]